MKIVISQHEVESLIRYHYKLNGGDRIIISRPRKRKAATDIKVFTAKLPEPIKGVVQSVDEFLASGQMIGAIKAYRTATMLGLKEAKDAIEDWQRVRAFIITNARYPHQ